VTLASLLSCILCRFFFFNDPATTEIYTLSLHDALPISRGVAETARRSIVALERALSGPRVGRSGVEVVQAVNVARGGVGVGGAQDRKSTRLNSSHVKISYAVFCLKKKKKKKY